MLYPLIMEPHFRHGEATPWGGDALRALYGKDSPGARTGESLEISALPGMESVVINGAHAGKTLSEMMALWGEALTGLPAGAPFPLLLKLLDAREMLSVQVHPGDEYAAAHHGKLGKTEAWVILQAPPGASIVYGVSARDRDELEAAIASGKLTDSLRRLSVTPGDVIYIPHGMVHALGEGIVVYEVQQSSDVTYRLWDWGRLDKDGNPRQLHIREALDVIRPELTLGPAKGVERECEGGRDVLYIADDNFTLRRLYVNGRMPLGFGEGFQMVTALSPLILEWQGGMAEMVVGQSALVPAALGDCVLRGAGEALAAGSVSDHAGS